MEKNKKWNEREKNSRLMFTDEQSMFAILHQKIFFGDGGKDPLLPRVVFPGEQLNSLGWAGEHVVDELSGGD